MTVSLLKQPGSLLDFRRRMNFVLAAERMRLARRILVEAGELLDDGMPAAHRDLHHEMNGLALTVQASGRVAAALVSEDYAARYDGPRDYERDEAGARFGHALRELLTLDRADLAALAADAQCVYRGHAAAVLALIDTLAKLEEPGGGA